MSTHWLDIVFIGFGFSGQFKDWIYRIFLVIFELHAAWSVTVFLRLMSQLGLKAAT